MNGFKLRHFRLTLIASFFTLIIGGANLVHADVVNAFLRIPAADSTVYDFGDQVRLKVTLTDANNDTLHADEYQQNGMTLLQLWVSGPKQDYHGVAGYAPLIIMNTANGFNQGAGFDPETGEITISVDDNEAGTGSYTALVKVTRRVGNTNYSRYAKADFLLGQRLATRAAFNSWNNCRSCHSPSRHATSDLSNCIVCHAKDSNVPMQAIIHDIGEHPQAVGRCTNCHKAGAGLTNFRRTACFSCHNAPGNHANYVDDQCAGCHTGNNSPYARHNIAVPTQPTAFNLTSPANGDTILPVDSLIQVDFNWQASRDNDNLDFVTYRFEMAENEGFDDAFVFDSLTATTFEMMNLAFNRTFWWRVRAEDLNSAGRWSNGVFDFVTHVEEPPPPPPPENHPPSAFGLVSPEDGGTRYLIDGRYIPFVWEKSIDIDSGTVVMYNIQALFEIPFMTEPGHWDHYDTLVINENLEDTIYNFDLHSFLDRFPVDGTNVIWGIGAVSQGDTTFCDSSFQLHIQFERSVREEDANLSGFDLLTAHPNPFNASTTISFSTGKNAYPPRLAIYDTQGKLVADLLAEDPPFNSPPASKGGKHSVVWNADGMAAGIYFVRLEVGGKVSTKKIVLVR